MTALLQVVDALAVVAFRHLLPHQSSHHDVDPLLADDGILRLLQSLVVIVVDAVEGGRDGRLLSQESLGFGGRHVDNGWIVDQISQRARYPGM